MDTTETIQVPKVNFSFREFEVLFVGKYGIDIEKLKKRTESDIWLENRNDAIYVSVNATDGDRLDNAVMKVKERIQFIINAGR